VLVCVVQKPHLLTAGYVQVMCRFSDAGSRRATERLRQVPILAGNSYIRSIRRRGHGTRPCPEFDAMHERYCGDLLNGVCAPRRGRMLAFQVRRSATWVTRPWHSGAALFHAHVVARHYRMACCEKNELNVWPHHSARHIRATSQVHKCALPQ
jgi:hypothetical protein